jgi:cell division ATPase FtsA
VEKWHRTVRILLYYEHMSLFSSSDTSIRYGAVIEIGSGSVLASIVKSDKTKTTPEIIWSKREYAQRRVESNTAVNAKSVITALMNVVLLLESEGKSALKQSNPGAKIAHLQVSMTAPWSYTITKVIGYAKEQPFEITEALLSSLITAAQKKITEELKENELASDLGLAIMTRATTDIQANDYKIEDPKGKMATTLTLTQVSAVAQTYLTDAIADIKHKVFKHADLERYSFMLMFHCIIRELYNQLSEYCLVDITYEATEIGVVRGGILRYCTHTPIGISTLARTLVTVLNIPLEEAYAFLKEPYHTRAMETMSEAKLAEVAVVFDEYQNNIAKLFTETGDKLSIPKILFMHGDHQTEAFFTRQLEAAAKKATNLTHAVHGVSSELLTKNYTAEDKKALLTVSSDTAMVVAAQFFHKQHHCNDFIQV